MRNRLAARVLDQGNVKGPRQVILSVVVVQVDDMLRPQRPGLRSFSSLPITGRPATIRYTY